MFWKATNCQLIGSSIEMISNSKVMFISDGKMFDVYCSGSVYGLVEGVLSIPVN